MRHIHLVLVFAFLLAALTVVAVAPLGLFGRAYGQDGAADGAPGTAFTYHGRLVRDGRPYDGACELRFRLYDRPSWGMPIGDPQAVSAALVDGLFAAALDFGPEAFQGDERWLAVSVKCGEDTGFTDLPGRQPIDPVPYANAAGSAPWLGVTGVPTGFADGVDDDTQYQPGLGLTLVVTTFEVDETAYQRVVAGTCQENWAINNIDTNGLAHCINAVGSDLEEIVAGSGLLVTNTQGSPFITVTVGANPQQIQTRVKNACPVGHFISSINPTFDCDPDDLAFGAGNQLSFKEDENQTGLAKIEVIKDGLTANTVDNESAAGLLNADNYDDGTLKTDYFSAWDDLVAEGYLRSTETPPPPCVAANTCLAVNDGALQTNLVADTLDGKTAADYQRKIQATPGTCPDGQAIWRINGDGTFDCRAIPTPTPGMAAAAKAPRVTGSCPPGFSISGFDASGRLICHEDAAGAAALIGVTAGAGLSGGAAAGPVALAPDWSRLQRRIAEGCPPGQFIQAVGEAGALTCAPDRGGPYQAAGGLVLGSDGALGVDWNAFMRRLRAGCPPGQALRGIDNATGSPWCEPIPPGAVAAVAAGPGLAGGGSAGSVSLAATFGRYAGPEIACSPGSGPTAVRLKPTARSVCALSEIGLNEPAGCRVEQRAGYWVLAADCGPAAGGRARCAATCFTW